MDYGIFGVPIGLLYLSYDFGCKARNLAELRAGQERLLHAERRCADVSWHRAFVVQ